MELLNLIWLQGQGCTGDTVALIGAREPSLVDALTGILPEVADIRLAYHPTIMSSWGEAALGVLDEAVGGELDPFVLVLEGALPDEDKARREGGYYCAVGERDGRLVTVNEIVDELKGRAAALVAVGTCAAFGGIAAARPNPTGAMGLQDFVGKDYRSALGLPVVNVPGCPAPGDNCLRTLTYLAFCARGVLKNPPGLDEHGRPLFLYGETVHEVCPRAGHLGQGHMSHEFGEPYCMGLLGCKGLIAHCGVPRGGFIGGLGGCPSSGALCIGCTEPGFPDEPFSPFLKKAPAWPWTRHAILDTVGHIRAALTRLVPRRI